MDRLEREWKKKNKRIKEKIKKRDPPQESRGEGG